MSNIETPNLDPTPIDVPVIINHELLSSDRAMAQYHKMGPTYELSPQDAGPLVKLCAQTLLTPNQGEDATQMTNRLIGSMSRPELFQHVTPARHLESSSMLSDTVTALGLNKEAPLQYRFGNTLLGFIEVSHKAVIDDKRSTHLQKAQAIMGLSNVRDELSRRGVRITRTELTPEGVNASTDSEESWRVRSLQGILRQREIRGEGEVKDGFMYEYVVASLLQFKLWQSELEDATTFARMATGREDQPAGEYVLDKSLGTMVAHDVVLELGGEKTRIQTKCGKGAHELGVDRYDEDIITVVADDTISSTQMNALMGDVIAAYQGSDDAIARVDAYISGNKGLRSTLSQ